MNKTARKRRWRRIGDREAPAVESILRNREKFCVGASSRFLRRGEPGNHIWALDEAGHFNALLIHWKQSLLPVFNGNLNTPLPKFLSRFLFKVHIHSIQGLAQEEFPLEQGMSALGYEINESLDYDLMALDNPPDRENLSAGPPGLIIRTPDIADMDALFELQAAYDREEVLPVFSQFKPAACRLNLEQIVKHERIMTADYGGRLVGKINTSAVSFTRYQIGGVYVHPDFRGLGIARRMCTEFSLNLFKQGWKISLFVKKRNAAARRVYSRIGFRSVADYRIAYFKD
ncbi:MAG: GNAT family N-acetyltransferase [Treponema sp.]|jgi:ribosomal protein S18 acetylase RimI-like enzyme|nr:GNAT family N-acetyltransferase [Treponema sp.]